MIYFGKVFFKILRLVPRTFLTTLKVLLVIFVNLLVKILLFLKFTLKIGEFIVPFSKNTTYLSPRGNSYLVRTYLPPSSDPYTTLDNNPPDVNEVIKATGVKHFILAFILAPDKSGCVPTWDGNTTRKVLITDSMVDCVLNSLSIIEIFKFSL